MRWIIDVIQWIRKTQETEARSKQMKHSSFIFRRLKSLKLFSMLHLKQPDWSREGSTTNHWIFQSILPILKQFEHDHTVILELDLLKNVLWMSDLSTQQALNTQQSPRVVNASSTAKWPTLLPQERAWHSPSKLRWRERKNKTLTWTLKSKVNQSLQTHLAQMTHGEHEFAWNPDLWFHPGSIRGRKEPTQKNDVFCNIEKSPSESVGAPRHK